MQNYKFTEDCILTEVATPAQHQRVFIKGQEVKWDELAYLLDEFKRYLQPGCCQQCDDWLVVTNKYIELFDSIGEENGK